MMQLQALGWTLACELPVLLLLRFRDPWMRTLLAGCAASLLTHPLAWHISTLLSPDEYAVGIFWIELGVVLVEAAWFRWWLVDNWRQAGSLSLLANAASFAAGWLVAMP